VLRISGGTLKNRQIFVKDSKVKPTQEIVRQSLFNVIDVVDSVFLDIFCGSGIVGIEAISRGANFVVFVDNNFSLCNQLRRNLQNLGIEGEKYRVLCSTWDKVLKVLEAEGIKFDISFVDPFYNFQEYNLLLKTLKGVVREGGIVVLEHSSRVQVSIPEGIKLFSQKQYGETSLVFLEI
jgi:16S rRNA (guanine966-N2)-methyltransferase